MSLYVAYFRFRPGTSVMQGLAAFERRKAFVHPHMATVIGEFWVNAPPDHPQVVLIWESEDEAAGDYYEAAWGDIFEITIAPATLPLSDLPGSIRGQVDAKPCRPGEGW